MFCALFVTGAAHAAVPLHDACDLAALPHAETLLDVPFDIVDGRIYVDAQVDDAGGRAPLRIGAQSLSDLEVRVSTRFPEVLVGAHALQGSVVLIDQRSRRVAICAATPGVH